MRGHREGRAARLVDGEAAVDAGAVDALALLVQAAHRGAHALGRHEDDVDVGPEVDAVVLHDAEQEAVRQPEGRARLERCE